MSNLLEKASIITTPTAYENGQLLSVKPNVNENLLPYSEDFSTFGGNLPSVIDNFGLAPNGTQTASKITFDAQYKNISQSLGFSSGTYTLSCYIKNIDGNSELYFRGTGIGLIYAKAITITNEWARYEATFTHNGTNDIEWQLQDRNSSGWGSCLIWGAQIVKGSKVGTYTKTEGTVIPRADFFFERGSSATRVNSQGLIEDVQIIGGDLVQNGDFSQEGSELITNGDFSTDSNWVKGGGWTIANGKATATNGSGTQALRTNALSITNGKFYKVQFTILDYSSGGFDLYLGNNGQLDSKIGFFNANGTYTAYHKLTGSNQNYLIFRNGGTQPVHNFSIDNVSVKEVGQNWSLGTGWSIENNKAKFVRDTSDANITQSNVFTIGNKYRVIIDVDYINQNGGSGRAMLRNPSNTTILPLLSVGLNEYEIIAQDTSLIVRAERADFEIGLNSISVKEITDDTDIPRIDYTDGVGNILLEPQSTNLVTYSEDFSQWNRVNNVALSTDSTVQNPDGTDSTKLTKNSSGTAIVSDDGISISASTTYVFSFFVKKGNFDVVRAEVGSGSNNVNVYYTFSTDSFSTNESGTQTVISVDSLSFANDWKRICIVFTGSITSVNATLFIGTSINDYVYYFGAQLEEQSFETSYIPTVGTTVTRLLETLNNSGNADLFNDSEGVLYAEIFKNSQQGVSTAISFDTSSGRLKFYIASQQLGAEFFSSGGNIPFYANAIDLSKYNKIAFRYNTSGETSLFLNGVKIRTSNATTSALSISSLSFDHNGNEPFYGKTKCVAVFKEALTDDELECLTGEGYESFSALAQAFNYTII